MSQFAVSRDENRKQFTKIYDNEADAKAEAERLCRQEKAPFIVIQIIARVYQEDRPLAYEDLR